MRPLQEVYAEQARSDEVPENWSGPPHMVDRIAHLLGTERRHRVLDVGCGLGGPARRLGRVVGCRVTGIDVVQEVVRTAATRPGPAIRYVVGEANRLPIADDACDQVWCLGALSHLSSVELFAAECARVLRPAGRVAITEAFRGGRHPPTFGPTAPQPWRAVTVEETTSSLRRAGLEDVRDLPWPGGDVAASPPSDASLARDLAEERLVARLVVATWP